MEDKTPSKQRRPQVGSEIGKVKEEEVIRGKYQLLDNFATDFDKEKENHFLIFLSND